MNCSDQNVQPSRENTAISSKHNQEPSYCANSRLNTQLLGPTQPTGSKQESVRSCSFVAYGTPDSGVSGSLGEQQVLENNAKDVEDEKDFKT
jgi:hypothetical protein